jgi:hypothetical protein
MLDGRVTSDSAEGPTARAGDELPTGGSGSRPDNRRSV